MNKFFLMLNIVSFTPDSQITVREILIPFSSFEECELIKQNLLITKHNIGKNADNVYCVTFTNKEAFNDYTLPWVRN